MREIFESTIERLLGDLSTPDVVRHCEAGPWPAELWAAVEASGFGVAAAPEEAGGAGASWDDLFVVVLALGRHAAPIPLAEAMLANWLLGRCGLEAVPGTLSFAADAGLRLDEGGRAIGRLADVPWGRHVEHVVAIAHGAQPTVVLLPVAGATLTQRLNTAGEPRDDLVFAGTEPVAAAPLPSGLPRDVLTVGGAMLRSAQIAGALQSALEMSSRYATERVQFGKPIANFQAIQQQLAVLAEHTAAATVAAEAAFAESCDTLAWLPVASAKVCAAEAASLAAGIAHTVHGAIGFTHEHALHLATRRLWSWRSEYGSLTLWSQRLGREFCAGGSAAFWPALTRGALPGQPVSEENAR